MTFVQKIDQISQKNNSLVCVGLDTDVNKIPVHLQKKTHGVFEFNKAIIDATADTVSCYKPNSAFYEVMGAEGITQLKMTCDYIRQVHPKVGIILDAKRADIGWTNLGYFKFAYEYLGVDAITLHPYLGSEALEPFLSEPDKSPIILCRTSNPGAGEVQDLMVDGKPFYQIIAEKVVNDWNANGNLMMVVGATYPEELATIRKIAGDMYLLVPGVGAQGGDVEKTVHAGLNSQGRGLIISSSRGIIYAGSGQTFAADARQATLKLRDEIRQAQESFVTHGV